MWDILITDGSGMTGSQRSSAVACVLSKLCCVSWRGRQTLRLGTNAGVEIEVNLTHDQDEYHQLVTHAGPPDQLHQHPRAWRV